MLLNSKGHIDRHRAEVNMIICLLPKHKSSIVLLYLKKLCYAFPAILDY